MKRRPLRCTKFGCDQVALAWKKKGQSFQTNNGHFTTSISGWYCPKCGGGYGGGK